MQARIQWVRGASTAARPERPHGCHLDNVDGMIEAERCRCGQFALRSLADACGYGTEEVVADGIHRMV